MQNAYILLGLLEDIKKSYIDTYVLDAASIKPSLDYTAWTTASILWMPGWGSHVEAHVPGKDDPFIMKTDSFGVNPSMRALNDHLTTQDITLPIELTNSDGTTYGLTYTEEGLKITITRSDIPEVPVVTPRKVATAHINAPHTHTPSQRTLGVSPAVVVTHTPSMWQKTSGLSELKKSLIEVQAKSITGVDFGYTLE